MTELTKLWSNPIQPLLLREVVHWHILIPIYIKQSKRHRDLDWAVAALEIG